MTTTTKRPKFQIGHTYQIDFHDAATGEHTYGACFTISARPQIKTRTPKAVHELISRRTRDGNTVTITEVAA